MRPVIACVIVAALSAFAVLEHYKRTTTANSLFPDPYRVGSAGERYREVAAQLPEDSVLGYISNRDLNTAEGGALFFGAQFALVPRILVRWNHPRSGQLVLGNFPPEDNLGLTIAQTEVDNGFLLEHDFGAGVVLFRKRDEQ